METEEVVLPNETPAAAGEAIVAAAEEHAKKKKKKKRSAEEAEITADAAAELMEVGKTLCAADYA